MNSQLFLVLIVGMMPFSTALQKTGGGELAAQSLPDLFGYAEPRLPLAALFVVTALISLFVSNTATAVLMAPIALTVADALHASPYPFVPLCEQIVNRIKANVTARLGEGRIPRHRYFIIPFAHENKGNDPESSHLFISVI